MVRFQRILALTGAFTVFLGASAALALSADDFIPPVQAKAGQRAELLAVKDAEAVRTESDPDLDLEVTEAKTLQDAINEVIVKPKQGCQIVRTSGQEGLTFVATGQGTYNPNYKNVVASRIEQRNAYVAAFMNAKAEMATTVEGIVNRGIDDFDHKREILNTAEKGLHNIETSLSEEQLQTVRKVLKGYVTYAVQDDEKKGIVYVTIVSSPKTRGQYSRNGTDGIAATSLNDGLNALIAEIQNGLVPPVGGRIIEVPGTGEVAWVGFGSAVVNKDPEPDVQAELDLAAEQMAGMRAVDALAGIILGDDTRWQGHADEQTSKQVKDFERAQQSDQTTQGSADEVKIFEERKRSLRSKAGMDTKIQGIREGVLPPGIMRRTNLDENEYFAYGIAVYIPSLTDEVREASREMDEAQIVRPPKPRQEEPAGKQAPKMPELEMKKGPSGVVQQTL